MTAETFVAVWTVLIFAAVLFEVAVLIRGRPKTGVQMQATDNGAPPDWQHRMLVILAIAAAHLLLTGGIAFAAAWVVASGAHSSVARALWIGWLVLSAPFGPLLSRGSVAAGGPVLVAAYILPSLTWAVVLYWLWGILTGFRRRRGTA